MGTQSELKSGKAKSSTFEPCNRVNDYETLLRIIYRNTITAICIGRDILVSNLFGRQKEKKKTYAATLLSIVAHKVDSKKNA